MIEILIRTAALFALVGIATFALRNRSAGLRHLLWAFAVIGAVLLPALTKIAPFQWRVLPAATTVTSTPHALDGAALKGKPAATEDVPSSAKSDSQSPAVSSAPQAGNDLDLASALLVLWVAGALLLLARLVTGLVAVNRIANRANEVTDNAWRVVADRAIRALGVRVPVEVRRSDEVAMPFACGLLRPVIVLPANADTWNAQQREAVLLHELAHISRGDLAMNVLSHVMRAVYWVNPLAWLAAHRLRVEGEKAADDAVLRGGARPSDYADHLLSIVRTVGNTVPNVALAMARRSDFEGRLLAILEAGVPRDRLTRARAFALAAVFVVVVLPLAAMTRAGAAMPTAGEIESALEAAPTTQQNTAPLPEPSATVAALASALDDATALVRLAAVQSLGNLQDPAAIAALAKALKEDTDVRVREAAAWSLGEIDDNRAVPHLLEALKSEKAPKVREKIVNALGEIDDASAAPGIANVLKDAAPEVRRAAVQALHELDDPNSLTPLMAMTRDDDVEVRRNVAQALGHFENPVALDAIISMTRDSDAEVRAHAIEALDQFDDPRIIAPLTAALKDASPDVRSQAADALGSIDNLTTAPRALIDALTDTDRDVRRNAASALGKIGDEAAVPALKKLVGDTDAETRRHAVEALKDIGGAEAIQVLMGLLKDADPEVRKTAAEALGKRRGD